jgi:hypothetical protein
MSPPGSFSLAWFQKRRMRMFRSTGLWGMLAVCVLALGLVPVMGGAAGAGEPTQCCQYKYVTTCKYVTTYETRLEPYTRLVTLYDTCGCAYTVTRTSYREVEVPVTKKVAVTERVAFCY